MKTILLILSLVTSVLCAQEKAAKPDFNPYKPEEFVENDDHFKFKWYTFSKRQMAYMKATEFDQKKLVTHLLAEWPIEKLKKHARETKQSRLPNKAGFGGGNFFKIDVYGGSKHKFDALTVTVYDQHKNSIGSDQSHHTNKDGAIDEVKRWGWLISFRKGKRSWSIQKELPNHLFDKPILKIGEGK